MYKQYRRTEVFSFVVVKKLNFESSQNEIIYLLEKKNYLLIYLGMPKNCFIPLSGILHSPLVATMPRYPTRTLPHPSPPSI